MGARSEKVELLGALELLATEEPLRSGVFVFVLQDEFECSPRAAKDAIKILHRGHYIERRRDTVDRRRVYYTVSDRGHYLMNHPRAERVLRYARLLFTGCPAPRTRHWQERLACGDGLDASLIEWERRLLTAPRAKPSWNPIDLPRLQGARR
jgi:DNA-binding MarR family transcriptional regulator